ncbi:hypothetical protein Pst134EA_017220 [Puccinia striiformis f. sp. tritici]|uniref:hypothetical protein n=1 Tax=Puccinia striiformis f. sp. tritici TaxID=168172 RepID=UPI002008A426|nr:hypothetical protein Pst134EA_017220 [Puccinia striiformis f. sp. tritici]KAH9460908.1 hypothetical protein Pst134EA_017220 [Puccinia striiformis f. sp. tritici]
MAEFDVIRTSIVNSLFSPHSKGSAGQTGQTYISHCKTWEDASANGERKPRYILLAVGTTNHVFLHKSKRNTNGSFSIGKTWDIIDLRAVELLDESAFCLVIGQRSYTWLAENASERNKFVDVLVRSYKQISKGELPQLIGLPDNDFASPAYPNPIPSSPVTSIMSSNSTGTRGRLVNPHTSPTPYSLQQTSAQQSPPKHLFDLLRLLLPPFLLVVVRLMLRQPHQLPQISLMLAVPPPSPIMNRHVGPSMSLSSPLRLNRLSSVPSSL